MTALLVMSSSAQVSDAEAQTGSTSRIAQQSLIVKDPGVIEPNIMYTIDDSGSMAYSHLPDSELADQSFNIHPAEPEGGDYVWYVQGLLATGDDNLLGARRRAPMVNKAYYNPEIRYLPWVRPDGTEMPDADPAAAHFHLGHRSLGSLTVNLKGIVDIGARGVCTTWQENHQNHAVTCQVDKSVSKIKPATYYNFTWAGMDSSPPTEPTETQKRTLSNYSRVSIHDHSEFSRGAGRDDCKRKSGNGFICTQDEEYRNFANWYQYHRTRMHIAIASTGRAFAAQPEHLRVGYGRINKLDKTNVDGVEHQVIERGVRSFSGENRENFISWLNGVTASGSTPLVNAMYQVGEYYKRTDALGPWSNTPGKASGEKALSCRRSYHVIMTDGKYNFREPMKQSSYTLESDNTYGPVIEDKTRSRSYQYVPQDPYRSAARGTLADYAMDLWKNDLHPNLDNNVPTDPGNPAFWQHVSTYTMSFGLSSGLNPDTDLNALRNGTKQWPNPVNLWSNDPIDDLWHAAVNSRGEYVNVQEGVGFLSRIEQILGDITGKMGNTAGLAVNAQSLHADNVKFVPSFVTREWTGNLVAYGKDSGGQDQALWNAAEVMPEHGKRNLFVGTGARAGGAAKSVSLLWENLPDALRTEMLSAAKVAESDGKALVSWMRGDQSRESVFRRRKLGQVIGHIVNSPPVYVGAAIDRGYRHLPVELPSRTASGAADYRSYVDSKKADFDRPGLVFVGSNSGVLHAFDARTGVEVYGYVPRAVASEMARSSSRGFHPRYLVDGPLVERDARWDNRWHNVLVGTTGAGPRAVFALNVTDTRTSALGASTVMWELNAASEPELGHVLAAPEIGVMRDGTWVAIFGNGYGSKSAEARLFVVNLRTGAVIRSLNVGKGMGAGPNGLGGVTLVRDGNQVITAAYAGDLKGNVWKFDLASSNSAEWKVGLNRQPLFTADDNRPITAAPATVSHPGGGLMVLVGTGKLFDEGDNETTDVESIYGLWDKDQLQADANGNLVWSGGTTIGRNSIAQHGSTLTQAGAFVKISSSPIDWRSQRGWRVKQEMLTVKGQRLIVQPQMMTGMALFQTMSPVLSKEQADDACLTRLVAPAFNLLLDPLSGAMATKAIIDTNGDKRVTGGDDAVGGWKVDAWSGRSVVLTELPQTAACTSGNCPQSLSQQQKYCPPNSLTNRLQSVTGDDDVCVDIPPPSRWWWREMGVH